MPRDVLKSEFATIEASVNSIAEQAANLKIDRVCTAIRSDVAKTGFAHLNEKITLLDAGLKARRRYRFAEQGVT